MRKRQTSASCLFILVFLISIHSNTFAQQSVYDFSIIKKTDWIFQKNDTLDYSIDNTGNPNQLLLKREILDAKGASIAYPKNLLFKDGTIEADIAAGEKSWFIGLAFRIKDAHRYETIYFRPGATMTNDAVQYMPELTPEFKWWAYEDKKYKGLAVLPRNGWFHVKLEVKGSSLTVYINNNPKPVYTTEELDASLDKGSVGFWLGNCTEAAYKNLKVVAN